jgi:hypothetical protein
MSFISKFMTTLRLEQWTTMKRVLRNVKGTFDFDILYNRSKYPRLCGYIDSNSTGFVDDRKSFYGYVFSLGIGAITHTSKKWNLVALSWT